MITSRGVDLGRWVTWKLGMPLQVAGQSIPIDDDIGQAIERV
jgi:hypothetical protein